jgi:hypothetical protein
MAASLGAQTTLVIGGLLLKSWDLSLCPGVASPLLCWVSVRSALFVVDAPGGVGETGWEGQAVRSPERGMGSFDALPGDMADGSWGG